MVVDTMRLVDRTLPRFKVWTTQKLNQRQEKEFQNKSKNGFGIGYIDDEDDERPPQASPPEKVFQLEYQKEEMKTPETTMPADQKEDDMV